MNIGVVGVLVVFGVFLVLLATSPHLSCFGRKLASPFYPLFRRKRMENEKRRAYQAHLKEIKTEDYGLKLSEPDGAARPPVSEEAREQAKSADDYGLKLD